MLRQTKTINSNFKVIFRNLQITYKYYFRKYPLIICWNKILHWWFCFSVVYLSQAISLLCSGSHIDSKHTSRNTCKLWVPRVTLKTVKGGMANIFKSTDIIVILIGRTSSPKMQLLKVASVLALNSFLSLSLFFLLQSRQKNWMTTGLEELSYMLCETAKLVQFFFFFWEKSILVKLSGEQIYSNLSKALVINLGFSKNQ